MKDTGSDFGWIGPGATPLDAARFGDKAAWLSRAAGVGFPVPAGVALPADAIAGIVGDVEALRTVLRPLERETGLVLGDPDRPLLVSLRPSVTGGGSMAPAVLNLGATAATLPAIERRHGARVAADLYRRLIQSFGIGALELEGEDFEFALHDLLKARGLDSEAELGAEDCRTLGEACLSLITDEGCAFPQDAHAQVGSAAAALVAGWQRPSARTRRLARGQDPDLPLSLILQRMVIGLGAMTSGAGLAQTRSETTGARRIEGRYLPHAQGEDALMGMRTPQVLTRIDRQRRGLHEPSLEEAAPAAAADLERMCRELERAFGDALAVEFTLEDGGLSLLEIRPARRSARAAVRIAVELAEEDVIDRRDALMRIDPALLDEHLHPSIDADAWRDRIGQGLAASPGAASGPLAFAPDAAEELAARGTPAILALVETSPEDIRGMHAAAGVLTVRGGMTSHAAVVARGLGKPCVVGARDLTLDPEAGRLSSLDGRSFGPGDAISVDGTEGAVLAGHVETRAPEITGAFASLMGWADTARRMAVRANADTAEDAITARGFNAAGIGLCRTEHMFFARGRITAMREMILADSTETRERALARLRPMQQGDFVGLFREMAGLPVVIRLLDPPLHEFLPHGAEELAQMAQVMGMEVDKVRARAAGLAEFNPMLGKRGCRIGIAYPEIYEMQARAILEAACDAGAITGQPPRPEIMIPLVSAVRELEVLRARIDAVAALVAEERGSCVDYTVGVMIETPRACLRAGDIARIADFLSFGTNDLTQMLYGLSRDDAGRFMPEYVSQGVFAHDPFHRIDEEGVGEIIELAIARARAARPGISIGLCGEHGGDPASVDFCERAGFDYVSCSPYRVPIARLAAAQARLRARRETAP